MLLQLTLRNTKMNLLGVFINKFMAEVSIAPVQVTPEARAVRSGGGAGGATELGKFKLGEWFKSAKSEVAAKIGLSKAEAEIRGNMDASFKIKTLGTKIVNGVNGIGDFAKEAADKTEQKSYSNAEKASDYEKRLVELRSKPVEAQRQMALYELANATLEMHGLPGSVGPRKGNLIERGREAVVRLADTAKERFFGWRAETDNRKAKSDLTWAVKYGDAAKVIHQLADNFEKIIDVGDTDTDTMYVVRDGKKVEVNIADTKSTAQKVEKDTRVAKEKSAEQFGKVITEGTSIGKAGISEINQQEVSDVKKQEQILKNLQEAVTKTGTQ